MSKDKKDSDSVNGTGNRGRADVERGRVERRRFLLAAGVGAAGLAGCVTTEEDTDTPTAGAGAGDGDGDGTATETETGASIEGPITIGAMGPADSPIGASILRAAELAVGEINDDGGIAGADVELVTKDTKDDPGTARTAYQELTTGEDVDFTVGIFGSEQLLAILPNVADQGKLHLSTGAATPDATRRVSEDYERFKYYFRAGPTNSHHLGVTLIDFAEAHFEAMGWNRIGLLAEDFKWTGPVMDVLDEQLSGTVDEIAVREVVPEGTEDFTPVYDEMSSADVDGVFTVLAHIGSTSLVQWAKQKRGFGYGGIHVPAQLPSYWQATEGACVSTFTNTTATPNSEVTELTVPYATAHHEEFGKYPVYTGYITYDAVRLLRLAVEEAGTTEADELVPVLESVNRDGPEFTGAAGIPSFYGPDHEFAHDLRYGPDTRGVVFQWQPDGDGGGSQEVIWPEDLATSEYVPPPWA